MATVPENLEKILQARYGEEVRGAIHDSIQELANDINYDEFNSMLGGVTKTVSGKSGSGNMQSNSTRYEISLADTDTVSVSVSEVNLGGGTLVGYQVRKISDGSIITTSSANPFEFSTNSPSGFTIRMFVQNPSSDFSAKFTVTVKRKTKYDDAQDKQILTLNASDEVQNKDILTLKSYANVPITKTVSGKSGSGNMQSNSTRYEISLADTDTVSVSVSEVNLGGGTLVGYQVRKISDGSIITTSSANPFEFSTNSPSGFTIRMFVQNPSSDFSAKFTVTVKRKTKYDDVIFGETNHRWENFGTYEIIGFNPSISRIRDSNGDYYKPPIEISGGRIYSVSVIEDGGVTEHSAYCVHSDSNNNKDKTLEVVDCYFESNSGPCIGVGTRVNYEINFRNCVFNNVGNSSCVYIHNTSGQSGNNPSTDNKSKISFVNCTFISHDANCLNLQDWKGDTDFCEFTFINCKFVHPVEKQAIFLDYRNYSDTDSTKWHNKFSLSTMSSLNSDDLANFS